MRYDIDDRRTGLRDLFPDIENGQVDVSIIYPGTSIFWHRHRFQNDFMLVVKGSLKVGVCNSPGNDDYNVINEDIRKYRDSLYDEWRNEYIDITKNKLIDINYKSNNSLYQLYSGNLIEPFIYWKILNEQNMINGPLLIPAGLWHGSMNFSNEPAILIYYVSQKYNMSKPDEDRCDVNMMGWNIEREIK